MMSKYHLVSQCDLAEISQLLLQYGQLTERALASKAAKKKPPCDLFRRGFDSTKYQLITLITFLIVLMNGIPNTTL